MQRLSEWGVFLRELSRHNRIEKCINEQGLNCKRADKDDTKRVIARYFGVKTNDETIEDHDGDKAAEKWIIPDWQR